MSDRPLRGYPTFWVCGVPFAALHPLEAAEVLVQQSKRREPFEVHLCSAYPLSLVDTDPELREVLQNADMNLPDGAPVSWFGWTKGVHGPVRGPGLVGDVARAGRDRGVRHYLYGGRDEDVAKRVAVALERHAPGVDVAGLESPPWEPLTDAALDELAERVEASRADIVWIGVSSPKQDYLVPRIASRTRTTVIPVGAAFDFWSGDVPEAPRWIRGTGFEWFYRLLREPRRLWRRYVFGNARFLRSALRHARARR